MKLRTDDKTVVFELLTGKEIELGWSELKQLETLIKILRSITDQAKPESVLVRL
ncbi:hypothetical protein ES702_06757 [subsurface metagenome]